MTVSATSFATLLTLRGISIEFHRGSEVVYLDAIPARTRSFRDAGEGYVTEAGWRGFLIAAESIRIGGRTIRPEPGDLIVWEDGFDRRVYRVAPEIGEGCWRWWGHDHAVIRVSALLEEDSVDD